jgi:Sulfotransferase family
MDKPILPEQNSVAMGGVGGSGTRLVAEIVQKLGFYIGSYLNQAHDNLWFTFLLKRAAWYNRNPPDHEINQSVALFQKAMLSGLAANISEDEDELISKIAQDMGNTRQKTGVDQSCASTLIGSIPPDLTSYIGWGWKEPNTHIFLPQVASVIDGLKYIHVIRNGLDMAFSRNQDQAKNWGRTLGQPIDENRIPSPSETLDFWITANRRAIEIGRRQLQKRFLLLNYDHLCQYPEQAIFELTDFLGVSVSERKVQLIKQMITPKSIGRYKVAATGNFSRSQMSAVRELGFCLDEIEN